MRQLEFEMQLETPVEYADTKNRVDASSSRLLFKAPNMRQIKKVTRVRGYLAEALTSFAKSTASVTANEPSQHEVAEAKAEQDALQFIFLLQSCKSFDQECFDLIVEIILEGNCLIDGTEKLTRTLFEKICGVDLDVYYKICGEYILNFLMPSSMR